MATDNGAPNRSSYTDVNVTILDVNDNGPIFKPSDTTIHIMENKTVNSPVVQMTATDDDATPANNNLTYEITSGDRGNFKINSTTVSTLKFVTLQKIKSSLIWNTARYCNSYGCNCY